MTIAINGKVANSRYEDLLVINGRNPIAPPPVINGQVPYDININGLDRPPILASCELYVPLWHPITSVSPFTSLDKNSHICTVTGTVWTPDGRIFDGDDYITVPTDASLNVGTGDFSVEAVISVDDVAGTYGIMGKYSGATPGWYCRISAGKPFAQLKGIRDRFTHSSDLLIATRIHHVI